jgi:hypothetical protein
MSDLDLIERLNREPCELTDEVARMQRLAKAAPSPQPAPTGVAPVREVTPFPSIFPSCATSGQNTCPVD